MSYVDNTSLGLLLAAASERAAGQTYWIADERPYSMNEIVDTVEDLLEHEFGMDVAHDRMRLPSIASEVALAVDAAHPARRALPAEDPRAERDEQDDRLQRATRRAPSSATRPRVELREGMRRSIRWCLENGQEI